MVNDAENDNRAMCATCVNPMSFVAWGVPICTPCAADLDSRIPTDGEIVVKYGADADRVAVLTAFTQRWVAWRKQQERAA